MAEVAVQIPWLVDAQLQFHRVVLSNTMQGRGETDGVMSNVVTFCYAGKYDVPERALPRYASS
jgi:hypothetical protein